MQRCVPRCQAHKGAVGVESKVGLLGNCRGTVVAAGATGPEAGRSEDSRSVHSQLHCFQGAWDIPTDPWVAW